MNYCEPMRCSLPTIEGVINDWRKTIFIVDTGASVTILDDALVKELRLEELTETKESMGVGGRIGLRKVRVSSIKIDQLEKRDLFLYSVKLDRLAPLKGIEGIIGYDLLAGQMLALETDGRARVGPPGSISTKGLKVSFRLIDSLIGIDVLVNSQGPFLFAVDTGANSSVIDKSLAEELGYKEETDPLRRSKNRVTCCPSSAFEAFNVIVDLRIGDHELKAYALPVLDLSLVKERCAPQLKGVVGYDILRRFEALIDYGSKQIFLRKEA